MKNQKIKLLIVCLCTMAASAISLNVIGQSMSDYKGVWHAIDKSGNLIELQLNSNNSCSFNINGIPSYHITAFKLVPSSNNSSSTQSPAMDIWFYSSANSSGSQNLNSSATSSGIVIYKASTKLSGNKLDLKVVLDAATDNVTEFNFSK